MAKKIETIDEEDMEEKVVEEEQEEIQEKTEKKKGKKKSETKESVETDESKEASDGNEETTEGTDEESLEEKIRKKKQKEIDQYNFQFVKEEKKILVDENVMEIKNLPDDKKIIGTKEVLRLLKKNRIRKIFLTKNTPKFILAQIEHIAKLTDAQLVYLKHTNNELGIVCRKPFGISILGVLK